MDKKLINRFRKAWPDVLKKWGDLANGVGADWGSKNCKFCQITDSIEEILTCESCPIAETTKEDSCRKIQYHLWVRASDGDFPHFPTNKKAQTQAKRIYNQLLKIKTEWDKLYPEGKRSLNNAYSNWKEN